MSAQTLWAHQAATVAFGEMSPIIFDTSDPGVGKTRAHIEIFRKRYAMKLSRKLLVLCPKSLMRPAWADDLIRFAPELRFSLAYANNRAQAFDAEADIYITNVDAASWLAKQRDRWFVERFGTNGSLIIDESHAYKNPRSKRSRAARQVARYFRYRTAMAATPNPNSVTELWHQVLLLDDGCRLGRNYSAFQRNVQTPTQRGMFTTWTDKPGVADIVGTMIKDISIRHAFDEVMDIPENFTRTLNVQLPPRLANAYAVLKEEALLALDSGNLTAINAAALATKLLQVASGAVYTGDGDYEVLDTDRYDLIADLIAEREHSVVFFNWRHQRDGLAAVFDQRGFSFGIIDGTVPIREREDIVRAYQDGKYQALLLHPKTGAHGLTLTRGRTTIWASPRYEADLLKQGIHRVYRGGQTARTENIHIQAEGTLEPEVYARVADKKLRMDDLLLMLKQVLK